MEWQSIEVFGHAAAVVVFTAVAYYAWAYRINLRRNVQRSRFLYRLILTTSASFVLINLARLVTLFDPAVLPGFAVWVDMISEYLSIIALSVIIFYFLANKIIVERSGSPRRILAIGAHPDDFDVAAGATLARLHAAGSPITGLVLSHGQPGGAASQHNWQPGDFLGLTDLRMLDFEVGCLPDQPDRLQSAIKQVIDDVQPELIFTHSAHDHNPDHRAVHAATLEVGCEAGAILCYESPTATEEFAPGLFVDVREYVSVKTEALDRQNGERIKPYLSPESIRGQLAYRGTQAKTDYAEGFEVVRLLASLLVDL